MSILLHIKKFESRFLFAAIHQIYKGWTFTAAVPRLIIYASFIFAFFIPLFTIWSYIDPLYVIFATSSIPKLAATLARILIQTISLIEFFKLTTIYIMTAVWKIVKVVPLLKTLGSCRNIKNTLSYYKKLLVWDHYTNRNYCAFVVPPALYLSQVSWVLTNYGTIRFFSIPSLHFIFYSFFRSPA